MNRFTMKKRSWNESFEALKRYKERHGNTLVPVHTCKEDPALGGWVNHQRSKKDKLTEEQKQKLDSIGFAWSCRERNKTWNPMIEALKKFQKIHGHCEVPEVYQADQKLADFVKEQRAKYSRGQLSAARLKQLEVIGLVLRNEQEEQEEDAVVDVNGVGIDADEDEEESDDDDEPNEKDESGGEEEEAKNEAKEDSAMIMYDHLFKQQYQKLVDFHIKNGHCRVPTFSRRGDTLGLWVASLKRKHAGNPETAMEPRCLELLEELDFFSSPAATLKKRFTSGLSRRLPISKPTVKPSAIMDEDEDSASEPEKPQNEDDVEDLATSDEGSHASSDEGGGEGDDEEDNTSDEEEDDDKSDAASATSSSSSSSIDNESDNDSETKKAEVVDSQGGKKRRRLSEVSQTSSARNRANYRDERFMKQFQDLLAFKKQYGHCRVPQSKRFKTLGGWVNNLRVVYNRDPENGVRPDRRKMLDEVGFIWNAGADRPGNDARWEEQFKALQEFKNKFGHCRVPQTGPHRKLGRWVATQRALYVKDPVNGIRSDRLQRLNDIEFTWDAKGYKGRHFYSIAATSSGENPSSMEEKKPQEVTSEAIKAESDATESDDDEAVAAQPVKVEEGGEAWAGSVDAVAIPSSQIDDVAEAAGEVKVKIEDDATATGTIYPQTITSNSLATEAPPVAAHPCPVRSSSQSFSSNEEGVRPMVAESTPVPLHVGTVESKPLVKQVSVE